MVAVMAVLLFAAAGLLVRVAPAHALVQREHVFAGSFGEAFGEGDKLARPSAIAVNEASTGEGAGDSYVLDAAADRVVRFGPAPEHKFLEAWGYGVEGGSAYQRCAGKCGSGAAGYAKDEFDDPVAIAVDNGADSASKGDVYVVANRTSKHAVVDKFTPTGEPDGTLVASKEEKELVEGMIDGVAVDQSGTVWIEREDGEEAFLLERFNDEPVNKLVGEPTELAVENLEEGKHPVRPGFAINAKGEAYVTYEPGGKDALEIIEEEEEIAEREAERKKAHEELKDERPQAQCSVNKCVVAKLAISGDPELEAETLSDEVDGEQTAGVAIDLSIGAQSSGDVYLDNVSSWMAFTSGGTPIQRSGEPQLQDGGAGLAVNAATDEILVADASGGKIDVFDGSPPGPPVVEAGSVSVAHLTATSAELRATIDPSGSGTHYYFEYGTGVCSATPTPCVQAPAAPGKDLGQAFGDQTGSMQVAGLLPSTTYHLLVVAENRTGGGGAPAVVVSEERTFVTAAPASGSELPDGRAWELVSPAVKHGASVEAIEREGGIIQAAADGRAITYMTSAPVGENEPEGNRQPERSQIISGRLEPGRWSARDIVTPNEVAEGVHNGLPREYQAFSPNLEEALVLPLNPAPLPLSAPATEGTLYLRNSAACAAGSTACFQPLVTASNDTAHSTFTGDLAFSAATPDLHHVILRSTVPLTAGETGAGLYEWSAGSGGSEGTLAPISLLPGGTQVSGELGNGAVWEMSSTAVSDDGARVVWGEGPTGSGHLYMRESEAQQTLLVDAPDLGTPAPAVGPAAIFDTASADGSKVFFTDPQRLSETSTAPEVPAATPPQDLYVFEPGEPAGHRVTDLSVDTKGAPGEGAGIQGTAVASEDGTFVYFVANGVLAEGASPGNCHVNAPTGAECNLYVVHYNGSSWESPHLIARLSAEDSPDWGRPSTNDPIHGEAYSLENMTSRVSPNGEYLAFMSKLPLAGYNNSDANSGAADEEVYLYKYGQSRPVCASCNPSGQQPVGVYDTQESGEGAGLVADRPQIWASSTAGVDHWLAGSIPGWTAVGLLDSHYQSRYLSDSGRLFFNSADSLVSQDINNGKEDVYEYEPTGVGSCTSGNTERGCVELISSGESDHESAFLDASENGNDVFFLTSAKLSPEDPDTAFDIYDARVCQGAGAAEPCPTSVPTPAAPCSSEECKPAPSHQPSYGTPGSATFSGPGNQETSGQTLASKTAQKPKPLTRAQKLAAALKLCKKQRNGEKRSACEAKARKSYGAKKATAKKSSTRHRAAKSSLARRHRGGTR